MYKDNCHCGHARESHYQPPKEPRGGCLCRGCACRAYANALHTIIPKEPPTKPSPRDFDFGICTGDKVRFIATGLEGRVNAIVGKRYTIDCGGFSFTCDEDEIELA